MPVPRSTPVAVLALATVLAAASCLPIPHTETIAPALSGQYRDADGLPVAGAVVAVSVAKDDSTCARQSASATTGADGRYALPAIRRRDSWTVLLPFDETFCWNVCAGRGGAPLQPAHSACRLRNESDGLTMDCTERRDPTTGAVSVQCAPDDTRRQRASTD